MVSLELIGSSRVLLNLIDEIEMVADSNCSVLIQGDTGTGKELVARAIHDAGPRRTKPFIALNCAAIPAGLLESELFGHEKGAFTGAVLQTTGRFLAAHGGTLFLDEIGDMPIQLQPKLLRVLQEQQFERVGSARSTNVDVRIIAATNLHLQQMVAERAFRADLFYRLNVFPLRLPSLRERKEDIPVLVRHFLQKFGAQLDRNIEVVPQEVFKVLNDYDWPGNVRELQNFVQRAMITSTGTILTPRARELDLMNLPRDCANPVTLEDAERAHIIRVLTETNWIVGGRGGAAARLGLPRTSLISRMQKLGLSRSPQSSMHREVSVSGSLLSPELAALS
jgi:formate hydrogenlyase transcriptional activator